MAVHVDPLSLHAGIRILSGQAVQTFNRDLQEYVSDRALVPLVMLPYVTVLDPENVQSGEQVLTGVEWYEGAPNADGSNRITANDFYELGDGTVEGFPQYALKVKKNVDANSPLEIFANILFVDKRRNTEVRVERSVKLYTALYDSQNFDLKITNQPRSWTIDPLRVVPDADGAWIYQVTSQLYSGKEPVDDAHAAYWWEISEDGGKSFREPTEEELETWMDCKDESGYFTKALTFDARMIDKSCVFRVRAAWFDTERPSVPSSEELQATTSVKVEMPPSLVADVRQTSGARVRAGMDTLVGFECVLSDNKGVISGKDQFFHITWFGRSSKPGSQDVELGEGRLLSFRPSDYGFEAAYPLSVFARVALYAGHSVVMDGDSALTDGESLIIDIDYE